MKKKKSPFVTVWLWSPVGNSRAEELDWVQRNTCEPHVAQPRSPTKEILCPLDHRGLSKSCVLSLGLLATTHLSGE